MSRSDPESHAPIRLHTYTYTVYKGEKPLIKFSDFTLLKTWVNSMYKLGIMEFIDFTVLTLAYYNKRLVGADANITLIKDILKETNNDTNK